MDIRLDGKVALVTGASEGHRQGDREGLRRLRRQGDALVAQDQDALDAAAADIGGEVAMFAANAGDIDAADACVQATIERFGGLDILVNNAATNPYAGPTMDIDPGRFDKTLQVNLRGPVFWCQSAWKRAFVDKPGVIVNIASVGGLRAESSSACTTSRRPPSST